jgi:hypothetical protein
MVLLNNQFMCMVEKILKIRFMLVLQVAQDVSYKIDFITPLLVSVYLIHVTQCAPACLLHRTPVKERSLSNK